MTAINISGRLSFEHIFAADSSNGSAPAYSATVLIDKSDQTQIQKIRAEIQRVATEKWKDKAPGLLKSLYATEKLCLRDGDNKEYDGYAGMMYVTSRNKARPSCGPQMQSRDRGRRPGLFRLLCERPHRTLGAGQRQRQARQRQITRHPVRP